MQSNTKNSLPLLAMLCILFSCQNKVVKQVNGQIVEPVAIEEPKKSVVLTEFDEFYGKFHEDSLFQMEHIIFPLEGKPMLADSTQTAKKFYWKKDSWRMHRTFDPDAFKVFRDDYDELIIEKLCDQMSFCLERRFSKISGEWFLIYYSSMNGE